MKNNILKGFYATGLKTVKEKIKGEDGKMTSENRSVNVRIEMPLDVGTSRIKAENAANRIAKKEKIILDGVFPIFSSNSNESVMVKRTKAERAKGVWGKHTSLYTKSGFFMK